MAEAAVNLIIKAPNQQIKDQVIKCDLSWTIGRLKEYLSEVYPSKPVSRAKVSPVKALRFSSFSIKSEKEDFILLALYFIQSFVSVL